MAHQNSIIERVVARKKSQDGSLGLFFLPNLIYAQKNTRVMGGWHKGGKTAPGVEGIGGMPSCQKALTKNRACRTQLPARLAMKTLI